MLYVTATLSTQNRKLAITVKDVKEALEVERQLFNVKTQRIINIRMSKTKPKLLLNKDNEIITDLASIEESSIK